MKILLFTDIHVGKRHSNQFYLDLDIKVIENIVVAVEKNNIDMIVFMGDLCHDRGELHQKALHTIRYILKLLNSLNIPIRFLLGNHDIYYNSTKDINYYNNIIGDLYKNIKCVFDIEVFKDFLFVGWLQNKRDYDNYNEIAKNFKWIFGHFEFRGISLNENYQSNFGYNNINKNSYIFSGHFHKRIIQDKLHYIGSPYPQTWSGKNNADYGYCVVDTEKETIVYENLNLFYYFEESIIDILIALELDKDNFAKKIRGNEIKMNVDLYIEPKKLNKLKMFINTLRPKNFIVENNWRFQRQDEIKYDNLILQSPQEFIGDFVNNTHLEKSQKDRIMAKVKSIIK